jgi:hypothetical protein
MIGAIAVKRLILASLAVLLLLSGGLIGYAQQNKKADENKAMLAQLKLDRVETAKDYSRAIKAAYDAGTVTLDRLLVAVEKVRDAELAAAETGEAKVKALQTYLDWVKLMGKKIQMLVQAGAKGGETDKALLSTLAVQDAEIALLSAMAEND